MVNDKKISGLVVLSEASWGCYPFVESVSSFLPMVDEMVVAFNVYGKKDGSRERVEALGSKVRIIPTVFDLEKYGWVSYGIARTMGYQACKGDIILMFDADGILHEKDHDRLNYELMGFIATTSLPTGYWEKHKFYKPDLYYSEHKHSGIYNKKILGDRLDFMCPGEKGVPNFSRLGRGGGRSKRFGTTLFGYEHLWDTEEVFKCKIDRYGRMIDRWAGRPLKTPEVYFEEYMAGLLDNIAREGKKMAIERHPRAIQKRLRDVNEAHFGCDFFGHPVKLPIA